jgi:hypothetical protein
MLIVGALSAEETEGKTFVSVERRQCHIPLAFRAKRVEFSDVAE